MPRQPRPVAADVPLHITQRGNNRLRCFFEDDDYRVYLHLLRAASLQAECRIHAYVLMSNHVHLLVSPKDELGPALMMKSLGQRYVQYVNRRYARTGTLWEGRYHSCLVHSETYLMVCQRYIELNPVRAGLVVAPALYSWSSYHHNAHGQSSKLVVQHELYGRLGQDMASRQSAYRALFDELIDPETLRRVRKATRGGRVLGYFGSEQPYPALIGRSVAPNPVGRPRKG
jgi:putative transposase